MDQPQRGLSGWSGVVWPDGTGTGRVPAAFSGAAELTQDILLPVTAAVVRLRLLPLRHAPPS
ncbi:hypothetical protein [Streptomyces werraensis]|uniref:hypothetical protein n=1 Tax=Streptomyces werraensis TaxID=68284 RepID=UPI00343F53EE